MCPKARRWVATMLNELTNDVSCVPDADLKPAAHLDP